MTPPIAQIAGQHKSGALRTIAVACAGGAALAALSCSSAGRVIAVFRRSFYVETAGGLACVGPTGMGSGPLNALCELPADLDWGAQGLRNEAIVSAIAGQSDWSIDLGGAAIWRPAPVPKKPDRNDVRDRIAEFARTAREPARVDGFAPLIVEPGRAHTPILRAARAPIAAVDEWLAAGSGLPSAAVLGLLGLGPGLTPSGDDYLGGVMVALHAIGRGDRATALAGLVVPAAPSRTNRISRAHLACAARGEGAGALHDSMATLLGASRTSVADGLAAVDAIGHTSGWDALAGALAVLRTVAA